VNAAGQNRAARRGWDQRVREARAKYVEVPMPDGDPIKVFVPDAEKLAQFFTARQRGSLSESLAVLIGEDNATRLQESALKIAAEDGDDRVPVTLWREFMADLMEDLGMSDPER
jgi:hypothetical protein